jgi:hypothetical protein
MKFDNMAASFAVLVSATVEVRLAFYNVLDTWTWMPPDNNRDRSHSPAKSPQWAANAWFGACLLRNVLVRWQRQGILEECQSSFIKHFGGVK